LEGSIYIYIQRVLLLGLESKLYKLLALTNATPQQHTGAQAVRSVAVDLLRSYFRGGAWERG